MAELLRIAFTVGAGPLRDNCSGVVVVETAAQLAVGTHVGEQGSGSLLERGDGGSAKAVDSGVSSSVRKNAGSTAGYHGVTGGEGRSGDVGAHPAPPRR